MKPHPKAIQPKQSPAVSPPQPMELAKLAALLGPNEPPSSAIEKAMQFYVEASLVCRELPPSSDELIKKYGSEARRTELMASKMGAELKPFQSDTLEFCPSKNDDELRRYMYKLGLKIKTGRGVIENIKTHRENLPDAFRQEERPSVDQLMCTWRRADDNETIYDVPRCFVESLVSSAKERRSNSKKKGWKKRKIPVKNNRLSDPV